MLPSSLLFLDTPCFFAPKPSSVVVPPWSYPSLVVSPVTGFLFLPPLNSFHNRVFFLSSVQFHCASFPFLVKHYPSPILKYLELWSAHTVNLHSLNSLSPNVCRNFEFQFGVHQFLFEENLCLPSNFAI